MTESSEHINSAFSKAAALCSRAEKSPLSIQKKTTQWGLSPEEGEAVLQRLFEHNFLNEQRFACFYVCDKYRFNRWGRIKIAYQLKNEGISAPCITQALEEIDDESYLENLRDLLQEKYRKTKGKDDYDLKMKVVRYAQGRGFEPELIFRTYDELLRE